MKTFGRRLTEHLDSLPENLRRDVKLSDGDFLSKKIRKVLDEHLEGYGTIDEILIALVKFENCAEQIPTRQFLANKLYRMCQEGSLSPYQEDGIRKRGAFQLTDLKKDNGVN